MSRILCAWSPTWAIANWRRRTTARRREGGQAPSTLLRRVPLPRTRSALGEDQSAPLLSSPIGGGGPPKAVEGASGEPPLALIETVRSVRRLAAVDDQARTLGLYPSQRVTDAMALCPELITAEADPKADAQALTALVDWCVRFSPAVAADPPDGLFLDITGVDHLWGGEAALRDDLKARLTANGLPFRLAIADTPGAAWALAHYGPDGAIAPPGGQAELLKPLPPTALRLDPEAAAQIGRLGLRRIEQLIEIPRAPLGRRFGAAVLNRLDQALGRAPEALAFRRPPTPWLARLDFFEPISAPDDMARVTVDVAARLCARLEAKGDGARRLELAFHRVDGQALSLTIGLALAGRDATRIARLFQPRLETLDPGFGIEAVTLAAYQVEAVAGRQETLDDTTASATQDGLAPLVDRLANRLGAERIWRTVPNESHLPEWAGARTPPLGVQETAAPPWDPETPRPIRLFRRPEPLEQVLALTPDDPPRQFRWRGRLHQVRRAEGPERIGEEWWRADIADVRVGRVRDYYRVEDTGGARFWLFRAGLYSAGEPARWWLHGLFG